MTDKSANNGSTPTSNHAFVNTLLFRLNADAKVGDRLSVFASAESLSYFNSSINTNAQSINSRDVQQKGETLSVTKAYFAWKLYENWVTFSVGRLPTTQGLPAHLKDGFSREGTYPTMAYSMPLDGFALTTKLSTLLQIENSLILRLIAKPGGAIDGKNLQLGLNLGDPNHTSVLVMPSNLFTAMLEYEQEHSINGLWEKMLGILQFGQYKFGAPPSTYKVTPATVFVIYSDNNKFLDFKTITPYLEFTKIFKTQFDFYATANFQWSEGFANLKLASPNGTGGSTVVSSSPLLFLGKKVERRVITGARYEFPNKYFLGFEYMKSGLNALPTNLYANSAFSPVLNGNNEEVYVLKQMYNNSFIVRLGFIHANCYSNLANLSGFTNTVEKVNVGSLSFNIKI